MVAMANSADPAPGDAYPPPQIARRVEQLGVAKARTDALSLFVLALLAGAFIALGALFYTVVVTGAMPGFGITRLIGGLAFSLGLVLVVIAGAELFTGNNLVAMAWASGDIRLRDVLRNWLIVYAGNAVGGLGVVALVMAADLAALGGGEVGFTAMRIAEAKVNLAPLPAFARGILCNVLVCLAVWLSIGARSVTDKILAVVLPVAAFVAAGLEHSIANWFFLPYGLALSAHGADLLAGAAMNLLVVTAGNIVGGTLLVAGVYWVAYLRPERLRSDSSGKPP